MLYILYNFHLFLGDWTLAIPYTRPLYSLSRSLVGAPLVVPELFGLACGFCIIRHQLRESTVGKAAIFLGLDVTKFWPDQVKMAVFVNKEDVSPLVFAARLLGFPSVNGPIVVDEAVHGLRWLVEIAADDRK